MPSPDEFRTSSLLLLFAGVCGALGSILPLVLTVSATLLSAWFRWDANALSELGVGDQALLFNGAVFLGGLLNIPFIAGLHRYLGRKKVAKTGVFAILAGSICLFLVGIFTVEYLVLHAIVALGYFIFVPAGFLLIGFAAKETSLRFVSLVCGITALLAILVLPSAIVVLRLKVGFAVPELAEAIAILSSTLFISAKLIQTSRISDS